MSCSNILLGLVISLLFPIFLHDHHLISGCWTGYSAGPSHAARVRRYPHSSLDKYFFFPWTNTTWWYHYLWCLYPFRLLLSFSAWSFSSTRHSFSTVVSGDVWGPVVQSFCQWASAEVLHDSPLVDEKERDRAKAKKSQERPKCIGKQFQDIQDDC